VGVQRMHVETLCTLVWIAPFQSCFVDLSTAVFFLSCLINI
jgi:hypothetical protein